MLATLKSVRIFLLSSEELGFSLCVHQSDAELRLALTPILCWCQVSTFSWPSLRGCVGLLAIQSLLFTLRQWYPESHLSKEEKSFCKAHKLSGKKHACFNNNTSLLWSYSRRTWVFLKFVVALACLVKMSYGQDIISIF